MSNRPCNYCIFERLKKQHREDQIVVTDDPLDFAPEGKKVLINGIWAVWFMKLPEKCEC